MPTIPTLPGQQVSTSPDQTPLQNINAPAGAFGAGTADAIGDVGNVLLRRAAQRKDETLQRAKAKELDIEYRRRLRELSYGTADKAGGYYNTRGREAIDTFEQYEKDARQAMRDVIQEETDPTVQQFFRNSASTHLESTLTTASRHRETETQAFQEQVSQERINNLGIDAALQYNNADLLLKHEQLVLGEVLSRANEIGNLDREILIARTQQALSGYWSGIIRRAVDDKNGPATAQGLLEQSQGKLLPAEFVALTDLVEKKTLIFDSNAEVSEILQQTTNLADALAIARERNPDNPELLKETERKLSIDIAAIRADAENIRKTEKREAFTMIESGQARADELLAENPGLAEFGDDLRRAETAARKGQRFSETPNPELMNALRQADPSELLELDDAEVAFALTEDEFAEFKAMQKGVRTDQQNAINNPGPFKDMQDAIRRAAPKGQKFGDPKASPARKAENRAVTRQMQAWRETFTEQMGRGPNLAEVEEQAAVFWSETNEPSFADFFGFRFGPERFLAEFVDELSPAERKVFAPDLDTVDASIVENMRTKLRQAGFPDASDEVVSNLIGAGITGNRNRARDIMRFLSSQKKTQQP